MGTPIQRARGQRTRVHAVQQHKGFLVSVGAISMCYADGAQLSPIVDKPYCKGDTFQHADGERGKGAYVLVMVRVQHIMSKHAQVALDGRDHSRGLP